MKVAAPVGPCSWIRQQGRKGGPDEIRFDAVGGSMTQSTQVYKGQPDHWRDTSHHRHELQLQGPSHRPM